MRRGATSHLLSVLITFALVALAANWTTSAAGAFAAEPGAPAVDPQQKQIADAIARLSSADPAEREEATRVLWAAGDAAVVALTEAAAGDDVEVARRASEILRNLHYGIRPDTPRAVIDLLNQYRQADRAGVLVAVNGLSARGTVGVRILSRLWKEEREAWRRTLLAQRLAERSRTAAALLLADGSPDAVLPLLEAAADASAPFGEQAMRDLAAYLLVRDKRGLDERVAQLKPLVAAQSPADAGAEPGADAGGANAGAAAGPFVGPMAGGGARQPLSAKGKAAYLLAYLCRARSDLPAARWAAEQSGDPSLLESLLVETADWKAMAARAARRSGIPDSIEDLGFAAAYHRMAGDEAGAQKFADLISVYATRHPDDNWLAAEALFLNDRPDAGMNILLDRRNYSAAAALLAPRMKFKELFDLAERARAEKSTEAAKIEARAAAAHYFLGDKDAGKQALEKLLEANERDHDFELYVVIAEAATAMRQPGLADECAVRALGVARPMDDLDDLFDGAGLAPGERSSRWWTMLRLKYKEPVRLTYGRLRTLLRGELPAAQLESLARAAGEEVMKQPAGDRDAWLLDIGQTLVSAGQRDAAKNFFRRLNAAPARPNPVPVAFVRLGDFEAEDGHWADAAALYRSAWEMDRTRPLPLLLRGHALTRIGREKEGRELIDLAHLMPLADEAARHELMSELAKRKLTAESNRERDLIVRTAAFSSWYLGDTLRRVGDEAYEKGEYASAATLWDRAFLDNQSKATRFAEPWANFAMPSLVHRARALGLMRSGDLDAARKEADLAMLYTPGDADALIAFVNELDKLGKKEEADDTYKRHTAPYKALCDAHPDSGQSHNQLAWAQAKCRRELDDAIRHAGRAVELEPDNTASLDTLAEAHFQRGEYQKAIETINKCIELEPKDKHHAEQLERFGKALAGGK
jgi:tetratricopeptide (TPR) repeat protein